MRYFTMILSILLFAFFISVTACNTSSDDGDSGNTGDTGNTADTADTGDTADSADTADTGDTGDSGDSADTADSADSGNSGDSGDGVISGIQQGDYQLDEEVTFESVVVAVSYYEDAENDYERTGIAGLYVSELIAEAKPYTGIFVHFATAADVDAFMPGDKVRVTGTYAEYYDASQVEVADVADVSKLSTATIPTPAVIDDPLSIATPFEQSDTEWNPTANHGANAEKYESVLVQVADVAITKDDLGHGMWEVADGLAIDKELYYYDGKRDVGKEFNTIIGILLYSYDAFKLAPRSVDDFDEKGDSGDSGDTGNTGDTGDTGDSGNTGGGATATTVKEIQKGNVSDGTLVSLSSVTVMSPVKTGEYSGQQNCTLYVSDETTEDYSGLYLYQVGCETAPETGDVIDVVGTMTEHNGQYEVKFDSDTNADVITVVSSDGSVSSAVTVGADALTDAHRGTFVEVASVTVDAAVDDHGNVALQEGNLSLSGSPFQEKGSFDAYSSGDAFSSVKGIYDITYNEKRLIILDISDISE